jgi:sulfatase-modifying factor enzyme 1
MLKSIAFVSCVIIASCAAKPVVVFDGAVLKDAGVAETATNAETTVKKQNCPSDMVEITANFCPKVDELCLYWVDIDGKRTNINTDRCGEFRKPVHCLVKPIPMHFCIDTYEYPNIKWERPKDWLLFTDASKFAAAEGKRLCTHREWTTAASGNDYWPYPFGDGFHRRDINGKVFCNMDNHIKGIDIMKVADPNGPGAIALRNKLIPSGSMQECKSETGVFDLAGNIDEWVINESGRPYNSSLVGGHLLGVRNRSRPSTDAHNGKTFKWYETGSRNCRDIIK